MSTIQEFENAPVGATARRPGSPVAVKVSYRPSTKGNWDDGLVKMSPETLVDYDYVLSTAAPTTSREALDLAWELAYPVKVGQVIPEGAKWMKKVAGDVQEHTMERDHTVTVTDTYLLRTHEQLPVPDPKPEWVNAPAVVAFVKGWVSCADPQVFSRGNETGTQWLRDTKVYHWYELVGVVPLYPKEG